MPLLHCECSAANSGIAQGCDLEHAEVDLFSRSERQIHLIDVLRCTGRENESTVSSDGVRQRLNPQGDDPITDTALEHTRRNGEVDIVGKAHHRVGHTTTICSEDGRFAGRGVIVVAAFIIDVAIELVVDMGVATVTCRFCPQSRVEWLTLYVADTRYISI